MCPGSFASAVERAINYNSGTVSRIDPAAWPTGADGVTPVGAVDFK